MDKMIGRANRSLQLLHTEDIFTQKTFLFAGKNICSGAMFFNSSHDGAAGELFLLDIDIN